MATSSEIISALFKDLNLDVGQMSEGFLPHVRYEEKLDRLTILLEDCAARAVYDEGSRCLVALLHPQEDRKVGVRVEHVSEITSDPRGAAQVVGMLLGIHSQ